MVKANGETGRKRPRLASTADEIDWALGPGSITWKVLADPAVFLVGLLREALLLSLHPDFAAAAVDHDSFGDDPIARFRHIAMYTYGATYGSKADAERYSSVVRRHHSIIVGTEPITGLPYRAHSEYELALTQVMLADSFLSAYEVLHGKLPGRERDQFMQEQKLPAALLGIPPEHMPDTYGQTVDFLAHARQKFASGLQGREVLQPFSRGSYPRGTVIGDLPRKYQLPAMFAVRAMADMSMATMSDEERALIAIDRRPKLGSRLAVLASYRALSAFFRTERGREMWSDFLMGQAAAIVARATAATSANGTRRRASSFVVPDAAPYVVQLPDLVKNWPGSTAAYTVGASEWKKDAPPPAAAVAAAKLA